MSHHHQAGQIRPKIAVWLTVAAVAVIVSGVLGAVLHGHHSSPAVHLQAAQPDRLPATTTTAAPPTTSAPTSTAAPTTTAAPSAGPTSTTPVRPASPPPAPAPTTTSAPTTTAAPSCVMSHNPACGPFYFSPSPAPDQPLHITVTTSPSAPVAGEQVTFHVVMDDADGPIGCIANESDGVMGTASDCGVVPTCDRYGAWPPPAPAPGHRAVDYTETYSKPGQYTFSIHVTPYDTPCTDARTGRGEQPYESSGSASTTITVS